MLELCVHTMRNNVKNVKNKRHMENEGENKQCKKEFDKKKYRLQKYSNKYKINQWEERRKKAVLHEFYKELQKDRQNSAQTLNSSDMFKNKTISNSKKRAYAFSKAKQMYQCQQEEKKKQIEHAIRVKAEREEALKKYKEKKIHNFKLLSRKTKKGQPNMKGRAEILLEKIQQSLLT